MVRELSYNTISHVMETWEQLRRLKNYEEVAGSKLFQHLFVKCPTAKVLFGFRIDLDPHCDEVKNSKRFLMHAAYLIQMLDTALNMLGPDTELLTEIMEELGEKHIRYGVKPEMFPIMGDSLVMVLEETLDDFSDDAKAAWKEMYKELSDEMIKSQVAHQQRKRNSQNR